MLRVVLCSTAICLLLVAAGCARMRQEGDPAVAPAAAPAVAPEEAPRYIRVSVYITDTRTNEPVADAEVVIGPEQLLPQPLPQEYGDDPAGLYVSETLEGGTYLFRVRRQGYRPLAGRLVVPPVPESIVRRDPPVVLDPLDASEAGGDGRSFRVLVLWQKLARTPAQGDASPHPPMSKPSGNSPHIITTHPIGESR